MDTLRKSSKNVLQDLNNFDFCLKLNKKSSKVSLSLLQLRVKLSKKKKQDSIRHHYLHYTTPRFNYTKWSIAFSQSLKLQQEI